jgi:hypothetical protein
VPQQAAVPEGGAPAEAVDERPPAPPERPAVAAAPGEQPASTRELRNLRRWLAVVAAWAVAATVVSVLAFLNANDDSEQQAADSSAQIRRLDRTVNARLDAVDKRLAALPQSAVVNQLQRTARNLTKAQVGQGKGLKSLQRQITALTKRVDKLETTQARSQSSTSTAP